MKGYSYAVAQYLDELASEEAKKRLNSVVHLMQIVKALGTDKTKSQLLPFLEDLLDDDDEIQAEFATQINFLVGHLGQDSIKNLMPHIEKLFTAEDSIVRENMLKSLHTICREYSIIDDEIFKLAQRLYESKIFSAKISSIMIICRLIKYIGHTRFKDILSIIAHAMKNKMPQVRSALAFNLKYLFRDSPKLQSDGTTFFKSLSKDPIETVRVNSIESIMFQVYDPKIFQSTIWPILKNLFEDASWRVKYAIVLQISDICKSAGKENTKKLILPFYAKWMVDDENELKMICAENLKIVVKYLESSDIVNKILPLIKLLASDKLSFVRGALASSVLSLAPVLGKKDTNKHILGIFLLLLRDECSDVQIKIFENFSELTKVLPATTLFDSISKVYLNLGKDKIWKNRVKCLETLLMLEREFGADFVNDKQILKLLMDRLSDKVYTVRVVAIDTIKHLSKKLGGVWAEKYALPLIKGYQNHPNYIFRINFYFGIKALAPFFPSSTLGKIGSELIASSKTEQVPNILVALIQALREIQKIHQDKKLDAEIKDVYSYLSENVDSDVRYYAQYYLGK